jgi:protein-arginine kinase activator protein McsA
MAYTLESIFKNSANPFDVAAVVRDQITALYPTP